MTDAPAAPTPAAYFRMMAERIEKNNPREFAGACLVIAPDPDGTGFEIIDFVLEDRAPDPAFFMAQVASRVQLKSAQFAETTRARQPGAWR
jgi:hypothetical protein